MPKSSKKTTRKKKSKKKSEAKLSDITGVGPATQKKLKAAGYDTVVKVAKAKPTELAEKVAGISEDSAKDMIAHAKKLAPKPKKAKIKAKKKVEEKPKKRKKDPIEQMIDELVVELQSADEQICLGAIDMLGRIEDKAALSPLVDCLEDRRRMIRLHAAATLGERGDKAAIDPLIESLKDESLFVRQTVAGALESIGGKKAEKAIRQAEEEGLLLTELPEGKRLEKR